ncbi:alpha/beta fold hydrolase [Synechococcus sp. CS-1324]|uniref:YheT family hydrolase n=1 Tax=Synechococcus sp. CS-1324 TaxID=2847980 RepID=UPI000DB132D5|nr:alpha/beta fold hydrolase [Synechococcus sp. CS-1324]MCT0229655.1 alpha/beta fold hydrolase [Synechococcus sp. CS-1324]PZV05960.1 MAG: alpha/beta hydrolase [Cyanobium sp.]
MPEPLGAVPFQPRPPWWGPDLQTLRDTLRGPRFPVDQAEPLPIPIGRGEQLLALVDRPAQAAPLGVVVLLHGLGGSSQAIGVRRLALVLQAQGFAVLRLNLRGAGAGRSLAPGTYAAHCNGDLLPALRRARQLAEGRPLFGVGFSLGGTVLLNGVLEPGSPQPWLDGLVVISSPLDLAGCSAAIGLPRNRLYERWLLRSLRRQTLADSSGLSAGERLGLSQVRSIRDFDTLITAPRWGFASVDDYYAQASPLLRLQEPDPPLPASLLIQALDDPWVPAAPAVALASRDPALPGLEVVLSAGGGHNGFHAPGGSWSDQLTLHWLRQQLDRQPPRRACA